MSDNCIDSTELLQKIVEEFQKYKYSFTYQEKEAFAYFVDNFDTLTNKEKLNNIQTKIDSDVQENIKKLFEKIAFLASKESKKFKLEYHALKKQKLKLTKQLHLMKLLEDNKDKKIESLLRRKQKLEMELEKQLKSTE